jgi:hypothetical protein
MITITNNKQAEELIKDGVLNIDDDLEIAFDGFKINADIKCKNIYSKDYKRNISARNISAGDISARNISARNISAWNISANDISANDISAWNISANDISANDISARNISANDISALDISARNISANDISAWDISYYAICFAYNNIKCKSISGRRDKSKHFCLDSEIEIIKDDKDDIIELNGKKYKRIE